MRDHDPNHLSPDTVRDRVVAHLRQHYREQRQKGREADTAPDLWLTLAQLASALRLRKHTIREAMDSLTWRMCRAHLALEEALIPADPTRPDSGLQIILRHPERRHTWRYIPHAEASGTPRSRSLSRPPDNRPPRGPRLDTDRRRP